jgi:hypothetical protein
MINRYKYTKQEMQKYNTALISDFEYLESDYYIFSREGDRLDTLAHQFYKDVSLWWIIANANNIGKGSMDVQPGLQIRIPYPIDNIVDTKLRNSELNR